MGYQQAIETAKTTIVHGVKKYVAPAFRVGTAKDYRLNLKTLTSDVFEPDVKINLTKELKSTFYKPNKIREIFAKYPYVSRRVGTLPPELAKKLNYNEGIEKFDEALTNFAKNFTAKNGKIAEDKITTLSEKLSGILGETISITPIGGGDNGYGYKIATKGKNMFFKCFYDMSSKPMREISGNGNYAEIASALHSSKKAPDKFIKFYMGKFGEKNDGYMLTEFVEGKSQKTKFSFRDLIHKFISIDPQSENLIKGKFIDFGMCNLTEYDKMKPLSYKILKKITIALDENSTKNITEITDKYKNTPEFNEALTKLENIILKKFKNNVEMFSSRKDLFNTLGLDYKPDLKTFVAEHKYVLPPNIDEIAKCYGISAEKIEGMRKEYYKKFMSSRSKKSY